jgi:hypothetical protein
MQATTRPFPQLMQLQHSLRVVKGSMASTRERSMLEVEMGGFGGEDAFLRPKLHWQCQLGTVPNTVK